MKKLVVIFMVLAMASIATAGASWQLSYDPGTLAMEIVLQGTDINQFLMSLDAGAGVGVFSSPSTSAGFDFTNTAGTGNGLIPPPAKHKVLNAKGVVALGAPSVTGNIWTGTFVFNSAAILPITINVTGYYKDGSNGNGENALGDILFVPEPMTMALLGLGGLFLRRRK